MRRTSKAAARGTPDPRYQLSLWHRYPVFPRTRPEKSSSRGAAKAGPDLPEGAREYRVQAKDAFAQKRFEDAVTLYGKALRVAPWWPEGHFNQALILGEAACYEEAIAAMNRYIALVPDAPDVRAARDKIYQWKGRFP